MFKNSDVDQVIFSMLLTIFQLWLLQQSYCMLHSIEYLPPFFYMQTGHLGGSVLGNRLCSICAEWLDEPPFC